MSADLCPQGRHLMDAANTWTDQKRGLRRCRACRRARNRDRDRRIRNPIVPPLPVDVPHTTWDCPDCTYAITWEPDTVADARREHEKAHR